MSDQAENKQPADESSQKQAEPTVSKAEFDRLLEQKQALEAKAVHYEKTFAGIDPEEHKALKEEKKIYERKGAKTEEELASVISEQLRGEYGEKLSTLEKNLTQTAAQLKEYEITDVAMRDAAGRFNDDVIDDVKDKVRRFVDKNEAGDLVVKDDKGNVRYSPNSPSQLMTVAEYMQELAQLKPSWARPDSVPGAKHGAEKSGTGNSGFKIPSSAEWAQMSQAEKTKFVIENKPKGLKFADLPR